MCIYGAISCDCNCLMNTAGSPTAPTLRAHARIGERINCQYAYTTGHTGSMSTDITSSLHFATQPVISATKEQFESTEDPIDMQQPPPHVVNYWYDHLELSLDLPSSENPSNATGPAFLFPLFDSTIDVS